MKRLCRATMLVMLLAGCGSMDTSEGGPAEIHATAITAFKPGSEQTRFGALEFLGGLELSSGNALLGALSAIRFRPDQRHFVSVLDTGHWLTGAIERDEDGRLRRIVDAHIMPMIDRFGETDAGKGAMDAEGLALRGNHVLVSYEQNHRVDTYPDPGFETSPPDGSVPILIPKKLLRGNRSLEALMTAPQSSPLAGAAVIVAERSLDDQGNMLAAILDGPLKGRFTVRHYDDFDASDGVFLPDGDLLLLERRFDLAHGIGVRIRRIAGGDIKPGAVVDGNVIFQAGSNLQIDNMEGLDAFRAADGAIHLIMVSDDNHSILQRSLMLEFRLRDEKLVSQK
ncbi:MULTISPECIES: esterase-like activity of phytase family protein [unclassified Rhizobium]|uniref:esterase-like activity of phytase family protein n=1 Tax=unclassified Rhizobium TaxID=2613769 RepID=UPI000CDF5236|nr:MULTISPECIES: esterase-like activity of phytase family protein [Rhizobium]AVA23198.1 phytase-like protein [Rhizobium sp. NXC24]MDK4739809.1 esterase-like activity of phytase family protein [Rhizobium sp. CNPSo 3464]UWU20559.1 esterase-like activity of phytase family protein [Rhizobium tropici]